MSWLFVQVTPQPIKNLDEYSAIKVTNLEKNIFDKSKLVF